MPASLPTTVPVCDASRVSAPGVCSPDRHAVHTGARNGRRGCARHAAYALADVAAGRRTR